MKSEFDIIPTTVPPAKPAITGLQTNHRKSQLAMQMACRKLIGLHIKETADPEVFNRVGIMTITFVDQMLSWKDAKHELDKMLKALKRRYGDDLGLVWTQERHLTGGIHFHILMKLPFDIRTGTDVDTLRDWKEHMDNPMFRDRVKNCHQFLNTRLRQEVTELSDVLKKYKVGRFDLLPILTDAESAIEYLSKGIARHLSVRREEDKGSRLWGCTNNVHACNTTGFSLLTPGAIKLRKQVGMWAKSYGCDDIEMVRKKFGRYWFFEFQWERHRYTPDQFEENCGIRIQWIGRWGLRSAA